MSQQFNPFLACARVRRLSRFLTVLAALLITIGASYGGAQCKVVYAISPQNTGAFGATIAIQNNGSTTLTNWSLTWSFANGQLIGSSWNGAVTQNGANVTVSEQAGQTWENIPAGGSYSGFGFNGTWNGVTNAIPTNFAVNGTACNTTLTATTTALSASSTTVATGASVTLTATISPSTATGTVTFLDGTTSLGTGTLSSGKATLSTSFSTAGTHSITAVYGGSGTFATSTSSAVSVTVSTATKTATTTALTVSTMTPAVGASVTLTATVSPSTATGTVTFFSGTTLLGTGTLSSGVATLVTSFATAGTDSLTAVYDGSATFATSTSNAVSVTVSTTTKAATTTALRVSTMTPTVGASVTLTATVSPSTATGTITFFSGTTSLGTGTLSSGVATLVTSFATAGTDSLTAVYDGSTTFATSTSSAVSITVSSGGGMACNVVYTISPQSSTAFGAAITIGNTGTTAWTSWTLQWTFANGQTIQSLWNGVETQSGALVTVTNESYNGSVAAGGSVTGIGFNGNLVGGNSVPTAFSVNGTLCGALSGNPPLAPSGLTATSGNQQIVLSWTASLTATSYNVLRSTTSGGPYTTVGTSATTSFTNTGLTNGTIYYYVVSAVNSAGTSSNSTQVFATPGAVPPNVTITVNPTQTQTISPYIYGTNAISNATIPNVPDVTIYRMGGNRWTAYNWETNASNAGSDFEYESDNFLSSSTVAGAAALPTIKADMAAGQATLMTVPMQGLVSGDESGPVSVTNPPDLTRFKTVVDQKSTVSSAPFTTTPITTDANVYNDEFVWAMNQQAPGQNIFSGTAATPTFVDLDNEPELWNSTHLEVQGSTPITPANYIAKTLALTQALKNQFPNIIIFGPSHYGFLGVYNWQTAIAGTTPTGANWFTDMYLQALSTASATYGKPLVDVYDFHWYPEDYDAGSTRVTSMTSATLSDADMQLIVQAPRNLWDPTFTDPGNSNPWVNSVLGGAPINMLGRLKGKISSEFPSMKLSISEYETGGFNNIAGTVAQADQLGVYASQGVYAAMFWPPSGTYDYELAGFRAFRNFDGANSNFGDTLLQSTSSNVQNVVVYVSTDSTAPGRVVLVAINRANTTQVAAISGLSLSGTAHTYQMTAATAQGQSVVTPVSIGTIAVSGSSLTLTLPAYSVTTIDVQ